MRIPQEVVAEMPTGTPVWLAATRDLEGQAPWRTTASADLPRFLAYGEWAAFATKREAQVWLAQRLAAWARAEVARLLKVARAAEKRAEVLAK